MSSSLVTAELATRCPRAGGEYVYLREAYGDGVAFVFGWGYTVFIAGGGVGVIAAALGESISPWLGWNRPELMAAASVLVLAGVNALGIMAGAVLQNVLGVLKVAGLVGLAVLGLLTGTSSNSAAPVLEAGPLGAAFLAAMPAVLWSYDGSSDSAKLAEEIKDVRRTLPIALVASAGLLTAIYLIFNLACLFVLGSSELSRSTFPAEDLAEQLLGPLGRPVLSALVAVTLAGALCSSLLSTSRVTFALARDGLAPARLAKVSSSQAPVPALALITLLAVTFTQLRGFREGIGVYFVASSILFGLSYASLLVFRRRDRVANGSAPGVFVCPQGPALAVGLILLQLAVAAGIAWADPVGAGVTLLMLGLAVVAYRVFARHPR